MGRRRTKASRKAAAVAGATTMLPTEERKRHDAIVVEDIWAERQRRIKRARVVKTLQIDILRTRKFRDGSEAFTERHYMTALKLMVLFDRSGLRPATTMSYSDYIDRGGYRDIGGLREGAYRCWNRAMDLVSWIKGGQEVLERVCIWNEKADGERQTERLRICLDCLAENENQWWDGRIEAA